MPFLKEWFFLLYILWSDSPHFGCCRKKLRFVLFGILTVKIWRGNWTAVKELRMRSSFQIFNLSFLFFEIFFVVTVSSSPNHWCRKTTNSRAFSSLHRDCEIRKQKKVMEDEIMKRGKSANCFQLSSSLFSQLLLVANPADDSFYGRIAFRPTEIL